MNDDFLKVSEVAIKLGVTQRTIINMIKLGKLNAVVIGEGEKKKSYRILKGEIDRFIAEEYDRGEFRSDYRETNALISAIHEEIKSFHDRLSALEEKNKHK